MHRPALLRAMVVVAPIVVIASQLVAAQQPGARSRLTDGLTKIHALSWLSGVWRGTFDQGEWEASYTTPYAGVILGVNKEIISGRVNMIEFEHFQVEDEQVVMTPYPFGKKAAVGFTLRQLSTKPDSERAVFSNPKHDFPREIVYQRSGIDRLQITITGQLNGQPTRQTLDLKQIRD